MARASRPDSEMTPRDVLAPVVVMAAVALGLGALLLSLAGCARICGEVTGSQSSPQREAATRAAEASVRSDWLTRKRAEHLEVVRGLTKAAAAARWATSKKAPALEVCAKSASMRLARLDAEQARMRSAADDGDDKAFDLAFAIAKSYSTELDILTASCLAPSP